MEVQQREEIFVDDLFEYAPALIGHETVAAVAVQLQKLLGVTPGNLDHHLRKLVEVGYVKTRHVLDWRPLKVAEITSLGAKEFRDYATGMQELLKLIK